MKLNRRNLLLLVASSLASFAFTAPSAFAAALTWDITSGDGATVTAGSGDWNTTAENLVWNNAGANAPWTQTSPTAALNSAIFGGTDGAVADYVVTLGAPMAASALTFNNTGYQITGSTLKSGTITVASGKTATINSTLSLSGNHTINGTLNLGGGNDANNSNMQWNGTGTNNLNAGTYTLSNQRFNLPAWNQTGGTVNLGGSLGSGSWIGYQGTVRNVNVTVSGGVFNHNGSAGAYLGIGRSWTNFNATLTVKAGGTMNFGNLTDGNLVISQDGSANTAKLDVQGGDLTVGTGAAANKITLFNGSAGASKNALMTQSGGTVTANGIQFGGDAGTINSTALATLQLSGGNLYVGQLGITRSAYAAAAALNYLIQLQGGTLGASTNWSSSLDMKLGTAGGGVTIKAANASDVARNITLSGSIADDTAVNGPLTKTGGGTLTLSGPVSYSGATLVGEGKLVVPSTHTGTNTATVSANAALGVTAAGTSQWQPASLTLANSCTLEFNSVQNPGTATAPLLPTTAVGPVSGVTINITSISGAVAATDSFPLLGNQDGTTTGYTLGTQPPGVTGHLAVSGTTLVYLVDTVADLWTGADGTNATWWDIATTANWTGNASLNSPAGTYADGDAVAFDDSASTNMVEIQANVAPGNMLFANSTKDYLVSASGAFGIGGSGTLTKTGTGTLTLSCPVSYSGATLVKAGKLVLGSTHSGTGAATVSANAVLGVTAAGTSQWQPASLALASPCTLEFNSVQNSGTVTAPLLPTAAVGTVSGVNINIKSLSGAVAVNNSYPLLGNQDGTTTGYTLGSQPLGITGALAVSGTTLVYVVETATSIWTGADGTNPTFWDIATTANWTGKALLNSPAGSYADGDGVLFNDTATPATPVAVAIQTAVAPGNLVFANSTKAYSISGEFGIGGGGTLTKTGTSTLTLGTDNNYSGATIVKQGTLAITHDNALGTTAGATTISPTISAGNVALSLSSATTDLTIPENLNFNGTTLGRATMVNNSSRNHTLSGAINLSSDTGIAQWTSDGIGSITVSGDVTGTFVNGSGLLLRGTSTGTNQLLGDITLIGGGVSKADTGTWTLGSPGKTYNAPSLSVGFGTVKLGGANFLAAATVVSLGNASPGQIGNIDLNGFSQTVAGITNVGTTIGQNLTSSSGTPILTVNNAIDYSPTNTILTGSLGLTKSGIGTLNLAAVNTYSGDTTVAEGTLTLSNAASSANANIGNDASTVTIADTGATLNLTYTGTDKVDKLVIGTTPQAAGVYGSDAILVPGVIGIPQITGNGTLTVGNFSTWIAGIFAGGATVPLDKRGPNDDPDNDGISNLVEYAIADQDPTVPNASVGTFNGTTLSFTKRADANRLTYAIQDSTDLGLTDAWAEVTGGSYVNNATTISYTLTPGTPPSNFIRLQVTQAP